MTWTAQVLALTPTSRGIEAGVVLSDGVSQKFVEQFQTDGTLRSLRNQVRARTVTADEIHTKPEFAVGDVLDLSPDPIVQPPPPPDPVPPTQAELDRAAFFTDLDTSRQQAKFDALSPDLQKRCLPEYVSGL